MEISDDAKRMWVSASKLSYIGIFFGVAICIGFFGGRWLDGRLHTGPWLSVVGLLVGIAAGFRELIRIAMRVQREEMRKEMRRDSKETT